MKILFIGGTGTISTAVSQLVLDEGHELYLINRGNNKSRLHGRAKYLTTDINDEKKTAELIKDLEFDAAVDFIAYEPAQLQRDYRLLKDKTAQFIFISSASVYQKPVQNHIITENTPLGNPFWEYSQKKTACEKYLMQLYKEQKFPVVIVRPSHTYSERSVPVGVHGGSSWQVLKRMIEGKPVIIHGDGTSLWTMTDSRDFAKGFIGLLGNSEAIGEAFHITSDESLTWNQIYAYIAQAFNVPLKPVHISSEFLAACSSYAYQGTLIGDKANSVVFDNTKIKRFVPGFQASIPFQEGVKQAAGYVLSHDNCRIDDEKFDKWCDEVIDTLNKNAVLLRDKFQNL